jgi:protein-arginine kinase
MGTDMGVISELDDKKIMKLLYYSKPYNLQKYYNKVMNNKEIAIKRCEIINDIIDEKI